MSNSFWVDDKEIIKNVNKTEKNNDIKLYLDCGLKEKELLPDHREMCNLLRKKGYNEEEVFCHFYEGAKHNEIDWAKRLHVPLTFLFGK